MMIKGCVRDSRPVRAGYKCAAARADPLTRTMSVRQTALYFDAGGVVLDANNNQPHEAVDAPFFFDEDAMAAAVARAHLSSPRLEQRPVSGLERLTLDTFLGGGGTGLAFLCERPRGGGVAQDMQKKKWVVKLPRAHLRPGIKEEVGRNAFACRGRSISQILMTSQTTPSSAMTRAFAEECKYAEYALEPPEMRSHVTGGDVVGHRLQNLTQADYARIVEARRRFQLLPGHAHLHPLLHFDASLPALFSAAANGTWISLREQIGSELDLPLPQVGVMPAAWTEMAAQLTSAVVFLEEHTQVVHLDIKPDNVFCRDRHHFWLGDFGICALDAREKAVGLKDLRAGSVQYLPGPDNDEAWVGVGTLGRLSTFQFIATLLDMLRVPPSASRRQAHFLSDGSRKSPSPIIAERLRAELPYPLADMPAPLRVLASALLEGASAPGRVPALAELLPLSQKQQHQHQQRQATA